MVPQTTPLLLDGLPHGDIRSHGQPARSDLEGNSGMCVQGPGDSASGAGRHGWRRIWTGDALLIQASHNNRLTVNSQQWVHTTSPVCLLVLDVRARMSIKGPGQELTRHVQARQMAAETRADEWSIELDTGTSGEGRVLVLFSLGVHQNTPSEAGAKGPTSGPRRGREGEGQGESSTSMVRKKEPQRGRTEGINRASSDNQGKDGKDDQRTCRRGLEG